VAQPGQKAFSSKAALEYKASVAINQRNPASRIQELFQPYKTETTRNIACHKKKKCMQKFRPFLVFSSLK